MWVVWARCVVALLACACQVSALPRSSSADNTELATEISLELRQGDRWQPVDAQTVFHRSDEIRFRVRSSIGGYLYVLNRSSDGKSAWLFPLLAEGQMSRIEPGPEYLVPGTKGSFVVGGKPGFDVTYWILSPVPIEAREMAAPAMGSQPSTLEPRCREEVLRARGLCEDERAGPHLLTQSEHSPVELPRDTTLVSRDLKFHTQAGSTSISAPKSHSGVMVYEFRIAHD